jgi:hypothetical protein
MEINIKDYLNEDEIKDLLKDELRRQVRDYFKSEDNANRLLINLSYDIVTNEVNKIVPNFQEVINKKVASLVTEKDLSYHLFNFDYNSGVAKSLGAKIIEQTIKENEAIIKDNVLKSILEKDYSDEAWNKFESLAEDFTHNIYAFVEAMRAKTTKIN